MSEKERIIYMKDEPLARMGELWAKLYYHLAKEMLTLGEEGEKTLRKAIRNYGKDRGEKMRRQALSLGLPLTYQTFEETINDMPFKEICEETIKYFPDAKNKEIPEKEKCTYEFCPYAEVWKNYPDGWDIAKIYCDEFHHAKWAAFNPKFKVDMVSEITRGDSCCILISYIDGDDYDRKRQKTIKEVCDKAKSYGFMLDTSTHGKIEKACKKA
jgi:hypothetical protein